MNHTQRPTFFQAVAFWIYYFQSAINNAVDFPLRNLIKWRNGKRFELQESKGDLYNHLIISEKNQANDIAKELKRKYRLDNFWDSTSKDNLRVCLFYLEIFDRALTLSGPSLPSEIKAADIGSGDWFYVKVLKALLEWWNHPSGSGRKVLLSGYEADPYNIYPDLYSRMDIALGHIEGLNDVKYVPDEFIPSLDTFHVITLLLPFVFVQDHLNSGLPVKKFKPMVLVEDAWTSLKKGGVLIIINRDRAEHLFQQEILASLNIEPIVKFVHSSFLCQYDQERHVLVAIKK